MNPLLLSKNVYVVFKRVCCCPPVFLEVMDCSTQITQTVILISSFKVPVVLLAHSLHHLAHLLKLGPTVSLVTVPSPIEGLRHVLVSVIAETIG